jgi:hypothetical protein
MPLVDFKCEEHGVAELLLKRAECESIDSGASQVMCTDCDKPMVKLISMPAKTATLWHGNWSSGLSSSGFHSSSVGGRVANKREEEKIMRARGFIREKDLGGDGFYDKMTQKGRDERERLDNMATTYIDNLKKFDGDKMKAVEHTFPAHEMLAQSEAT